MQANTDRLHAQVEMTGSPKPPSMTAYGSCKLRYPDRLTSWHCVRVRRIRSESIILSAGTFRRLKPCPKLPKRHAHSSSSSYLRLPIPLLICTNQKDDLYNGTNDAWIIRESLSDSKAQAIVSAVCWCFLHSQAPSKLVAAYR